MNKQKDIVDYLNEKNQLEKQLKELRSKKERTDTENVIIEEMERRLVIVQKQIDKY